MTKDRPKGALVVIALALLCGLVASWAWAGRVSASEREERDDLDLFLDASSAGWAEVTRQFFESPESSALTVGSLLPQTENQQDKIALLAEVVRRAPNLDAAFIGYPDGQFLFVGRSDDAPSGGFRTRVIAIEDGTRRVDLSLVDASLVTVEEELDVDDSYDPTQRPWYRPVVAAEESHWTEPYVFSSSELPGITFSVRVNDASGDLAAVVGVDIQLSDVSEFLEALSPGENGEALVVDDLGRVIASSPMREFPSGSDGTSLRPLPESQEVVELVDKLDGVDDWIRGASPDDQRTTIVRRAGVRNEWYLAVRALDTDFIDEDTARDEFEVLAVGVAAAAALGLLGLEALRYLVGLKQEADFDDLTQVSSRRAIRRALHSSLERSRSPVYVAIVDLDDFKSINDSRGHAAGDAVLRSAARTIDDFAAEAGGQVGRLGGDEFLIFGDGEEPAWQRLIDEIEAGPESLSASVGVAISTQIPHSEMDQIFRAADRLLFEAKRSGRGTFCRSIDTSEPTLTTIE